MLSLVLVFALVSSAVSTASTSLSATCSASTDVDKFYMDYVYSREYVETIKNHMLAPATVSALSHVFDIAIPDHPELAPAINRSTLAWMTGIPESVVPDDTPISGDDFITSQETFVRLDSLISALDRLLEIRDDSPDIDWYTHDLTRAINLEFYYLYVDTSHQSTCKSFQCHAWRVLIQQTHYRCAQGLFLHDWSGGCLDFHRTITSYLEPLRMQSGRCSAWLSNSTFTTVNGKPKSFAPLVILVPIAVEVGCWCIGKCIRYYRDRQAAAKATAVPVSTLSTTGTPHTPDPRVMATMASTRTAIGSLISQITLLIVFDASVWTFLRNFSRDQIVGISKSLISIGADPDTVLTCTFDLSRLFNGDYTSAQWASVRSSILTNLDRLGRTLTAIIT